MTNRIRLAGAGAIAGGSAGGGTSGQWRRADTDVLLMRATMCPGVACHDCHGRSAREDCRR